MDVVILVFLKKFDDKELDYTKIFCNFVLDTELYSSFITLQENINYRGALLQNKDDNIHKSNYWNSTTNEHELLYSVRLE